MKIKEYIAELEKEEREKYWERIRQAKSRGKKPKFSRIMHIHLPIWMSRYIIETICPNCELAMQCSEYIDIQNRKLCILLSDWSGQKGKRKENIEYDGRGDKRVDRFITKITIKLSKKKEKSIEPFDCFGKLMVIFDEPKIDEVSGNLSYQCICDCGNITWVRASDLLHGKTKSCGKCRKESSTSQQEPQKSSTAKRPKVYLQYRKIGKNAAKKGYSSRIGCSKFWWTWVEKPASSWVEVLEDGQLGNKIMEHSECVFVPKICTCGGNFRFEKRGDVVCDRCGLVDGLEEPIPFIRDWDAKVASDEAQSFIVGAEQAQIEDWRELLIRGSTTYSSDRKPWPYIITPEYTLTNNKIGKKLKKGNEATSWLYMGRDYIIFGDLASKIAIVAAFRRRTLKLNFLKEKIKILKKQLKHFHRERPEEKSLIASTRNKINTAKKQLKTIQWVSIINLEIKTKGNAMRKLVYHKKTIEGHFETNTKTAKYPFNWNLVSYDDKKFYSVIRPDQVTYQKELEKIRGELDDFDGSQINDPYDNDNNSPIIDDGSEILEQEDVL